MALFRTFIAVEVGSEVRSRAVSLMNKLKRSQANVSWTAPQNLHLTLQFLGDTADAKVPEVCRVVTRAAARADPIALSFAEAGAFPRLERPRTVWIGVDAGSDALRSLQADIESQLLDLGIPRERRRFTPHLTIGRVRSGGPTQDALSELLTKHSGYAAGATTVVDEVLCMASFQDREGPTYQVLGRASLG